MCQGHFVLQESNLEMVDRGLLDSVPDVLETCNLKHDTYRAYSTSRMCVSTQFDIDQFLDYKLF